MNQTYLLIGGNLGNRFNNLEKARSLIAAVIGKIINASAVYETEAWGIKEQPAFLNQVLIVSTSLDPDQLLSRILSIEHEMGRERTQKFGPRSIDIDILFYNQEIIDQPGLIIPHPQLHLRRFTLEPLNEISPSFIHPLFDKSIAELLQECPDNLVVKKL